MIIKDLAIRNNIFLAPLAGVSDMPFRVLCKEQGCGAAVTEMISAKGLCYNNKNTEALLVTCPEEHPVGVQLFGSEPEIFKEAASIIDSLPFDFIDINMGCPVPKIFNNGEGSALLMNPERIPRIVEAVKAATKKPVTVKIRTGIDENCINAVLVAKKIEQSGADLITVHGRHRKQYYSGSADWDTIAAVKRAVSIPVIANGDVTSPCKAKEILEQTGCDGVMVGRAAMGNPWIFRQIREYLLNGETTYTPSINEIIDTAVRHAEMTVALKGAYVGVLEMRKHLAWYTKGFPNSAALRRKINEAATLCALKDSILELTLI